jgi:hypothetical protein
VRLHFVGPRSSDVLMRHIRSLNRLAAQFAAASRSVRLVPELRSGHFQVWHIERHLSSRDLHACYCGDIGRSLAAAATSSGPIPEPQAIGQLSVSGFDFGSVTDSSLPMNTVAASVIGVSPRPVSCFGSFCSIVLETGSVTITNKVFELRDRPCSFPHFLWS